MDAILGAFTQVMGRCKLQAPRIPYISNVTGEWIKPEEATDARYWSRHLRETVRFAEGLAKLWEQQPAAMLEAGPGRVLAGLAARHPGKTASVQIVSSLRSAQEAADDPQILLAGLAQLWVSGIKVNWNGFHAGEHRRRVELPTYPFERRRYWIDAPKATKTEIEPPSAISYFQPVWKRAELPAATADPSTWVIFMDSLGVGAKIASELERAGHKVVTVAMGDRFAKTGKSSYNLDPGSRADYDRLLENLQSTKEVPQRILHLWPLVPRGSASVAVQNLETAQAVNFYSLFYLAQAIGVQDISSPMSLAVVSNGLQSVAGETVHHPERAILAGPGKVISKEFTSIRTR